MMRYQVLLEHDPETGHWTATVPGLPHIIVDASTEEEAIRSVQSAIRFAREEGVIPPDAPSPSVDARLVAVDV